jgi:hypothetical protein
MKLFRFICWLRGFHTFPCWVWRSTPIDGKPFPDLDMYANSCVTCGLPPPTGMSIRHVETFVRWRQPSSCVVVGRKEAGE